MIDGKLILGIATGTALGYSANASFLTGGMPMMAGRAAEHVSALSAGVGSSADRGGGPAIFRGDDGLFHLTAEVNGVPVRFVVDTGASVIVLAPRDARRTGVEMLDASPNQLRTAAGNSRMNWARIAKLRIGEQELDRLDAAVVQGGSISLLGQNALTRLESMTIAGNQLNLR